MYVVYRISHDAALRKMVRVFALYGFIGGVIWGFIYSFVYLCSDIITTSPSILYNHGIRLWLFIARVIDPIILSEFYIHETHYDLIALER